MLNRGTMSYAALGIAALAMVSSTLVAKAARAQTCFTHPVRAIDSLAALPSLIRGDLSTMSDRDGPFNGTDTIIPGVPITRFTSAGQVGDLYFVWYELGGSFYSKALALYRMKAGGTVSERVAQRVTPLNPRPYAKSSMISWTGSRHRAEA